MDRPISRASGWLPAREKRRGDWLTNSLLSGFVATIAMTAVTIAAYGIAKVIGDPSGGTIARWFGGLADNALTDSTNNAVALAIALNLLVGLAWSLAYGADGMRRLTGPGWRRGMIFALVPWLLSITVFFPVMDAGFLGRSLHAGPLPVIGNLILHLVYGAVLGGLYAVDLESWLDGSETDRLHARAAERGAAFGMLVGIPTGLALGWLVRGGFSEFAGRGFVALMAALLGGALGAMSGGFAGIERGGRASTRSESRPPARTLSGRSR